MVEDVERLPRVLGQFNWLDWVVVLVVGMGMLSGLRQGLVSGALDLLRVGVGVAAAAQGYRSAAEMLQTVAPAVPPDVAAVAAFLVLLLLAPLLFSLVVGLLAWVTRPLRKLFGPLAFLNRGLGIVPGAVKGALAVTVLLLPFATFPLVPPIAVGVEGSVLAGRLVAVGQRATHSLGGLLGQELTANLSFVVPPQAEGGLRLPLQPLGRLMPDPDVERRMLELLNQERARVGLPPLTLDEELRAVARAHSLEMFEQGYFAHVSPSTGSPFDRLDRAGIRYRVAGENLAYAPNVRVAHDGLMDSPGHRANILRPEFGRVGIGVIRSDLRGSMFTQAFRN